MKPKQRLAVHSKQVDNRRKAAQEVNSYVLLSQLVEQTQRLRSEKQLSGREKARLRKLEAQIELLEQEQGAENAALLLLLLTLWPETLAELEIEQGEIFALLSQMQMHKEI